MRDQIAALLPRASVGEVDATTTDLPDADVLIGTEAVLHRAEGTPGRPLRLVAFLEFDQELLAARYRAAEQALTLLARAARLVGGRARGGRVLVQTRLPEHEVLESVQTADPRVVGDAERARRRALGYPPFGGLAEISGSHDAVAAAFAALDSIEGLHATRPGTSATARMLVLAATSDALCDALAGVDLAPARALGRLRVEVDPLRV
jgi:primosomal protein N' (replication factor Y)